MPRGFAVIDTTQRGTATVIRVTPPEPPPPVRYAGGYGAGGY